METLELVGRVRGSGGKWSEDYETRWDEKDGQLTIKQSLRKISSIVILTTAMYIFLGRDWRRCEGCLTP